MEAAFAKQFAWLLQSNEIIWKLSENYFNSPGEKHEGLNPGWVMYSQKDTKAGFKRCEMVGT